MTTRLEEFNNALVNKIENLRDKTGKPGSLKDFQDFDQVERFSDALWENGLKTNDLRYFYRKIDDIRNKKLSDVKPQLLSLTQELMQYTQQSLPMSSLKKVLDSAIKKNTDDRDFKNFIKLADIMTNIVNKIVTTISKGETLKNYPIRSLVKDTEEFGQYLSLGRKRLTTTQIRKFLDAVNNIKLELYLKIRSKKSDEVLLISSFPKIDAEFVLLKQKIAYASARKPEVQPLKEVMDAAIYKVQDSEDFERFFQMVESIIAYHKYAGGE